VVLCCLDVCMTSSLSIRRAICSVCLAGMMALPGVWSASAQDPGPVANEPDPLETAWTTVLAAVSDLQARLDEIDATDVTTTRGHRLCLEAIAVADTIITNTEFIVANDPTLTSDDVASAWDQALTARQTKGWLQLQAQQCEDAQVTLRELVAHPESASRPLVVEAAERRLAEADACVERQQSDAVTVAAEANGQSDSASTGEAVLQRSELPPEPRGFRVGHGFLVAGGALLAGAVGHELAMSGDRSDFVTLRDACEAREPCDTATLEDLQGTLQAARVISAILYGASAVSFGTGAVLLLADRPDRPATTLLIEPAFTSRFAGISMTLRR
jgi:hypothetical protein